MATIKYPALKIIVGHERDLNHKFMNNETHLRKMKENSEH